MQTAPSVLVPGALGAFAMTDFAPGALILAERAEVLSRERHDVDTRAHNDRFAWSMAETLCQRDNDGARSFCESLVAERYARGIAQVTWEPDGDGRALDTVATRTGQSPALVRMLYDFMGTNALTASLVRCSVNVPDVGPAVVLTANQHGFFPRLARVNHSCAPNATTQPTEQPMQLLSLVATRAIAAGEEITINYLSDDAARRPVSLRSEILENFGFRCMCALCRARCGLLTCTLSGAKRCPCHAVGYCGAAHQREDWPRHSAHEHRK